MEGRPTNEEPGRSLRPCERYSSPAARRRAFLLLDRERASLKARLRDWWHPLGRYEDLCLITMLTRLERDWLTRAVPRLQGSDRHADGEMIGRGIAEWAGPWSLAPIPRLDADARRFELALGRLARWLSPVAVAGAERSARERLERISAELEERDPGQTVVPIVTPDGKGEKTTMIAGAPRIRTAAAVGLLLAAAAAIGLLAASRTGSRTAISPTPPTGAESGISDRPTVLGVDTRGHRVTLGGRAGHAAHRSGLQGGQSHAGRHRRATGHQAHGRTTVVSTPVAPSPPAPAAPEPAPIPGSAEPVPASVPAPLPQSPIRSPSPAPSKAESAGGGGGSCPPEFGYEC
jgi:hypothetical protein